MTGRTMLLRGGLSVVALLTLGCVRAPLPAWLTDHSDVFPRSAYVLGVGQGATRAQARERAYAAVARVFVADVQSRGRDWVAVIGHDGPAGEGFRQEWGAYQETVVTTARTVEWIQELAVWVSPDGARTAVLAGVPRAQAERGILDRLQAWDREIRAAIQIAQASPEPLAQLRAWRIVMRRSEAWAAANQDLQVIRLSGQIEGPPLTVEDARQRVRQIAQSLVVQMDATGPWSQDAAEALRDGLRQAGTRVDPPARASTGPPTLRIQVFGAAWPLATTEGSFHFVRWCVRAAVQDGRSGRELGALAWTGKEGHLTEREAQQVARAVLRQTLATAGSEAVLRLAVGEPVPQETGLDCPPHGAAGSP